MDDSEFVDACERCSGDVTNCIGVPGVLATIQVERCDACERFPDDVAAAAHLRRMIRASPLLHAACEATLTWLTNCNANDPASLARLIMAALEAGGYDKAALDDAAIALVRGPCSVPNMMGDDDEG